MTIIFIVKTTSRALLRNTPIVLNSCGEVVDNLVGKKNALACVFCLHISPQFERFALGSSAAHQPSDLPNAETPQAPRASNQGIRPHRFGGADAPRKNPKVEPAAPRDPVRSPEAPVKKVSRGQAQPIRGNPPAEPPPLAQRRALCAAP